MNEELLRTKLYIPPLRPNLVPRPRLFEQLNQGLQPGHKLTLISAPAGFGKTTLLADWARTTDRRVSWLHLDPADNERARFLAYLVTSLQVHQEYLVQDALTALDSIPAPPVETILTSLINELASMEGGLVLVLDDYHVIESQEIHEAITFLLEYLPAEVSVIISTRVDPPLPLHKLRGQGQLIEIRADRLRFDDEETRGFLANFLEHTLSQEELVLLHNRLEGWVAGLQMLVLSLQGKKKTQKFVESFSGSHRFIMDYLMEEVFNQQEAAIQRFLLRSSILGRLSGPLCDYVLGEGPSSSEHERYRSSQEVLEHLDQSNLFLLPMDDERRWYRYHHLFASLLRQRLHKVSPDEAGGLLGRAANWFAKNGYFEEAFDHALAAGDGRAAAKIVERQGYQLLTKGSLATLLRWFKRLPDELVKERPGLSVIYAWVLVLSGSLDDVEKYLMAAEEKYVPESDSADIPGQMAAIRAYLASLRWDAPGAIELARQAFEQLPEKDLSLRSMVALILGNARTLGGDTAGAMQGFTEARRAGKAAGNLHAAVLATFMLANQLSQQGQLRRAFDAYNEALALATKADGQQLPVAARAYNGLTGVHYKWNELDIVIQHASHCIELGQKWGNVNALIAGYAMRARAMRAQGDLDSAYETLQEAERLAQDHHLAPGARGTLDSALVDLWLAQGNLAAASRWARKRQFKPGDQIHPLRESEYRAFLRVLLARDEADAALTWAERLIKVAESGGRMGWLLELLILQTTAFQARNDERRALDTLQRALSLAEPEGYVRSFLNQGKPMERLLRQAKSQGIAPRYVAKLLSEFEKEPGGRSLIGQLLIDPLSGREIEVLQLIAEGYTNPEIAEKLVIAVGTVKAHTSTIYGKLDVGNRTEAAVRARELGIL